MQKFRTLAAFFLVEKQWPEKREERRRKNSASADGGPRSCVCARGTLRSAPIGTSGNFPARVSAESISPKFPILVKIGFIGGVGGVTEIRFSLESSSFCYLGAQAKIQNPSCLLSGRKAMA